MSATFITTDAVERQHWPGMGELGLTSEVTGSTGSWPGSASCWAASIGSKDVHRDAAGAIYVLTDAEDGLLPRLTPKPEPPPGS